MSFLNVVGWLMLAVFLGGLFGLLAYYEGGIVAISIFSIVIIGVGYILLMAYLISL